MSVGTNLNCLDQLLEPGLKLVRECTGMANLDLPDEAVLDTEIFLCGLFQRYYATTLAEPRKA